MLLPMVMRIGSVMTILGEATVIFYGCVRNHGVPFAMDHIAMDHTSTHVVMCAGLAINIFSLQS